MYILACDKARSLDGAISAVNTTKFIPLEIQLRRRLASRQLSAGVTPSSQLNYLLADNNA
jgi:hypothetical protein